MAIITYICPWCKREIRKEANPKADQDMISYGIHASCAEALEARDKALQILKSLAKPI